MRLHLLCRVVDNFGDAGICWRLARQLATEFGWQVRLTIDRPELLAWFDAAAPTEARPPAALGRGSIAVERWPDDASVLDLAALPAVDLLISAFGAPPPAAWRARLAGAPRRPLWINLEYLSAEDWIDDCHGLHSIKPADGACEHFYYPGFTERSGGLLREHGLIERRSAFVGSAGQERWLASLGIVRRDAHERLITLFCYPDAPVAAWLALLAAAPQPSTVLVPESVADPALAAFLGRAPAAGQCLERGVLRVKRLPFLPQDDYDRLLWSADLNFVRGEDSWIRAHWAGRPFVWQAYQQREAAHLHKLRAFLRRLDAGPAAERMMLAWNARHGDSGQNADHAHQDSRGEDALAAAWAEFDARMPALAGRFTAWSRQLAAQSDLATRLADFCAARL